MEMNLSSFLLDLGDASYDDTENGIRDLGLVSPQEKAWLLHHCRGLTHPSKNESFSRSIMEAWHCNKPVIVSAHCEATLAVLKSGGGFSCDSQQDWIGALNSLLANE